MLEGMFSSSYLCFITDRYVMLGNHRDSWVLGAIDPSSGTATMMELSRVLGQLVKESNVHQNLSTDKVVFAIIETKNEFCILNRQ